MAIETREETAVLPILSHWIDGTAVEVLAEHEGIPVLARAGRVTVASFHPELAHDSRLHAEFVEHVTRLDSTHSTSQSITETH